MKRFGYVFDPLFLACCAFYAANRWLIKPHCHIAFFHNWCSDVLLIPCALPILLLAHRWLKLRHNDNPPTPGEIATHVAGWSVFFEVLAPRFSHTVGDPWDAAAYAGGGIIAYFIWRTTYERDQSQPADFDFLAPYYDWMERVLAGRKLQRCRTAFLKALPSARRALVLGPGRGPFLPDLLRTCPEVSCVCVDSSINMLEAARARLRKSGVDAARAEFVHADVFDWEAPRGEFDLIVSNFFLDCFRPEQLERLLPKLAQAAAPDCRWLVADFCEPPAGPASWRARAILETLYLFFRWATGLPALKLTAPDALLFREGFTLRERQNFDWGLLQSDLWVRSTRPPPSKLNARQVCKDELQTERIAPATRRLRFWPSRTHKEVPAACLPTQAR